jgi:glucokinase
MAQTAAIAMQDTPRSLLHQLATPHTVTAAHVAQAAAQGDELAARLMEREARLLGVGMLNTLYAFSPDIMLVGGGVVLANPLLLERARQVIQQHAIADIYHSVPIEVTHLGEQVGVIGAAALAFYEHDRLSNDNDIDTRHT